MHTIIPSVTTHHSAQAPLGTLGEGAAVAQVEEEEALQLEALELTPLAVMVLLALVQALALDQVVSLV